MHGAIAEAGIQSVTRDTLLSNLSSLIYSEAVSSMYSESGDKILILLKCPANDWIPACAGVSVFPVKLNSCSRAPRRRVPPGCLSTCDAVQDDQ